MMYRLILSVVFLALAPLQLQAQTSWPLASVGVFGKSNPGGCSGALIESDVVLTAAHCVLPAMKTPTDYHFRTGAYPGLPSINIPVAEVALHPFYLLKVGGDVSRLRFDIGLVKLAEPVSDTRIVPISVAEIPEEETRFILAGYRGGRGDRARERQCEVFREVREALALACEVDGGESGSPIIYRGPDGLSIVGVLSSKSRYKEQPVGYAAPVVRRIKPVQDALKERTKPTP